MKVPVRPPAWEDVLSRLLADDPHRLSRIIGDPAVKVTANGRYRHWDSLRYQSPPADLTHDEWWLGIKLARRQISQPVPLRDTNGEAFTLSLPGVALQLLQRIDQNASGQIAISEQVTNPAIRRSYLVSSLIEEAIRSSQLEGAATSRQVAKEMLQTSRPPRTRSERMIVNNYHAMNFVRENKDEPLTSTLVLELHRLVTAGTLDDVDAAGRLQVVGEERVRVHGEMGNVLHTPPPAGELPGRLAALCEFANQDDGGDNFIHPVVRSVVIHFWLGFDHPFVDGNGRTARALFYWSMLRRGYWLTEFLSISGIIQAAPAKYARSLLYTEWDDNDLTYFVLHQLAIVVRAIDSLKEYLQRKMVEVREVEVLLRRSDLNHRQTALLGHALRKPGANYTIKGHAGVHQVVNQSARTDLLALEERGLLGKRRFGRAFVFRAVPNLRELLR